MSLSKATVPADWAVPTGLGTGSSALLGGVGVDIEVCTETSTPAKDEPGVPVLVGQSATCTPESNEKVYWRLRRRGLMGDTTGFIHT